MDFLEAICLIPRIPLKVLSLVAIVVLYGAFYTCVGVFNGTPVGARILTYTGLPKSAENPGPSSPKRTGPHAFEEEVAAAAGRLALKLSRCIFVPACAWELIALLVDYGSFLRWERFSIFMTKASFEGIVVLSALWLVARALPPGQKLRLGENTTASTGSEGCILCRVSCLWHRRQ